jgi:DNA-binding transcriptional ArsR family regulator
MFAREMMAVAPAMALRLTTTDLLPNLFGPATQRPVTTIDDELEPVLAPPMLVEDAMEPWPDSFPTLRAEIVGGNSRARASLVAGLRSYHKAPYGRECVDQEHVLRSEITHRSRQLDEFGIDSVLSDLHPHLTWRNPILTLGLLARRQPVETDLGGRGLIFAPSLTWSAIICSTVNSQDPLIIVYPISPRRTAQEQRAVASTTVPLARLLGGTRARVLAAIARSPAMTTTQLARDCHISLASASEHASVLRDAGMTTRTHQGSRVQHHVTKLGTRVIEGH